MKFKDLPVGSAFKFEFEKEREWEYTKEGPFGIKCISAPKSNQKAVGQVHRWEDENQEVVQTPKRLVCLHCFVFIDHKDFNEFLEKTVVFKNVDDALAYKKSVIDQYDTFQLTWVEFYE